MNILWAHDHTFYFNDSGKFFSSGKLPYAVWERYLSVFDRITVVSRAKKATSDTEIRNKSLSSGANVDFIALPSLSNPVNKLTKKGYVERILTESIEKSDAVIARLPSEIGAEAISIAKKLNKPFAVEVVACAWDGLWNYGNMQGKMYAPFATMKTKSLVKQAPFAIYVTRQFLQKRYPCASGHTEACSNVEIPEMSVDVLEQRMDKIKSRSGSGTGSRTKAERTVIGLIGSLNGKTKGIDVALQALAKAKPHLPPFQFRILGDGNREPWEELVRKLGLQNEVEFCGVLPSGGAVFEWLDDIDLYLQPSFQEGLPRATIEAMSRGCPVIGSTAGGIPELIDSAYLHKPGSVDGLAGLLKERISDSSWMLEQACKNFHKSQEYTKVKLDRDRKRFWENFREYVSKGG